MCVVLNNHKVNKMYFNFVKIDYDTNGWYYNTNGHTIGVVIY